MCHISGGYKTDFNVLIFLMHHIFDEPYLNILLFEYTTVQKLGVCIFIFICELVTKAAFIWYKITFYAHLQNRSIFLISFKKS